MFKKLHFFIALLLSLSLILGACASPAAAPVVTDAPAPVVTEAPTQVPPTPVPPTPEPPPDWGVLFQGMIDAKMSADKGFGGISSAKLNEELATSAPFLLDVREVAEIEKNGYIEGAIHIPIRDLLKNLDKLPGLDAPIVVYCASGHRGGYAFAALNLLGYTNVRNLGGGIGAWIKADMPVVTGSLPAEAPAISTPIIENEALFTALDEFLATMPADKGFYSLTVDALAEAMTGNAAPMLVDLRSEAEVEKDGYIEGSLLLPVATVLSELAQIPAKNAPIVALCASGHRGAVVVMALRLMGYTNVINLGGGVGAWKNASMPLVGGAIDQNKTWTDFLGSLPADQGFYSIKAPALNTALAENPPFLLDVREISELESSGYITGAIHVPVRDVLKNLDKLPAKDKAMVVYCGSGHRGAFVVAALRMLGWTDVANLNGGTGAWLKAEFQLEAGIPEAAVAGEAPIVDDKMLAGLDAFLAGLPDGFDLVKAADLNSELAEGSVLVIDVRTPAETATGYIEGAVLVPVTEFMPALADLAPDKAAKIVVLCQSGHRGGFVMMALRMLGYTDVRNLGGGMNAWAAAELPVIQ